MNGKMTTNNYQQMSPPPPKKTKQTTRTGTESWKWILHGVLSVGRGKGENGGTGPGNKKHKC